MLSLENKGAFCEFWRGSFHRRENLKTVFLCRSVTRCKKWHTPDTYILIECGVKINSYVRTLTAASIAQPAIFSLHPWFEAVGLPWATFISYHFSLLKFHFASSKFCRDSNWQKAKRHSEKTSCVLVNCVPQSRVPILSSLQSQSALHFRWNLRG